MLSQINNTNVSGFHPLLPPRVARERAPITDDIAKLVVRTRSELRALLRGEDARRLAVIVGPCSIHDREAAYEYAERLRSLSERVGDAVLLIMRTYFEKPRTTVGWKGLINDPYLDGSCDLEAGLQRAREILLEVNRIGVPCASEALDPITPQYISDLLSWASIGARTTESQTHREMASGLSMPVGFKNSTDGSLDVAVNALISTGQPHTFLGINADGFSSVVKTTGNPDRHVVLRGGRRPNYYREDVDEAVRKVTRADPALRRAVMVDTSHGNSSKDPTRQAVVCRDVLGQYTSGQTGLLGLLIESNLVAGRQDFEFGCALEYGVSLTDACMGWDETASLIDWVASEVRSTRQAA